jgi:hypothetical protein
LDKCAFEVEIVAVQGAALALADESVWRVQFEGEEKIKIQPTNEQLGSSKGDEDEEFEIQGTGSSITIRSKYSLESTKVPSLAKSFLWLDKYTLLGTWQESKKLYLSPLKVLARCSPSNVSRVFWLYFIIFVVVFGLAFHFVVRSADFRSSSAPQRFLA